jgi:hypothetical protein
VTTLAVLGRPTDAGELTEIHRWPSERLAAALAELERSGVVVREAPTAWVVHNLLRDAIARHVGDRSWRRAHRGVAGWLEATAGSDVTRLLVAMLHRRAAGLEHTHLARRILESPMRRAVGQEGLHTLLTLVDQMPAHGPVDVELRRGIADLADELGQHTISLERWLYVAERAADPDQRARAWLAATPHNTWRTCRRRGRVLPGPGRRLVKTGSLRSNSISPRPGSSDGWSSARTGHAN